MDADDTSFEFRLTNYSEPIYGDEVWPVAFAPVEASATIVLPDREAYDHLVGFVEPTAYYTVETTVWVNPHLRRAIGARARLRRAWDVLVWDLRGALCLPRAQDYTVRVEVPAARFHVELKPRDG